jgi:sensor histidine kinase regulating citrate/malate metabolism
MIFRITWLKDNLKNKALENQSLAAYSSGLEKNMDGIRNIKHDIKNIFLTMGRFVEQSGDGELQAFYREKISPFANEEMAKSDLCGKLAAIDNEQLKAFLFYKISQAVERGLDVDLDISPRFTTAKMKMEFTDLVRILGILLDNAIEECMELEHGIVAVKISCNDNLVSYIVKNTVAPERKANGIKPSVSSKGIGRGNGLVIVRGILENYDCVTLNSYFAEDCFVQNLIVYQSVDKQPD